MEVRQRMRWFYTQLTDSTKVVWAAAGISLRLSVCFQTYPQVWQRPLRSNPVDLLSTLYFMTLKDEMPSLTALRSWNNSLSFPVEGHRSMISVRGTKTLQNMGLNNDLCFVFFSSRIYYLCCGLSLPHLPLHSRWFCGCLHQGHWEASRRRGSDSLSADEGT